jgi:hypothetical protein
MFHHHSNSLGGSVSLTGKFKGIRLSAIALACLFVGGCSTPSLLPCATTDWYELGRRHGATGSPESEGKVLKMSCNSEEEKQDALALYENGRSLGIAEYCTEENGFEMGRTGQKYLGVCPMVLEETFRVGYKRGERASKLQSINEKLKKQDLGFARKGLLEGQKLQLQDDQRSANAKKAASTKKLGIPSL